MPALVQIRLDVLTAAGCCCLQTYLSELHSVDEVMTLFSMDLAEYIFGGPLKRYRNDMVCLKLVAIRPLSVYE